MADTLSIKVSDENKELFKQLAEENCLSQGDFLNRLLSQYQTQAAKGATGRLQPAYEVIETLTSRLLDVVKGADSIIATIEEERHSEVETQQKLYEQKITEYDKQIKLLSSENDELEKQVSELEQKVAELKEDIEKNDTIQDMLVEYRNAVEEMKQIKQGVIENVNEKNGNPT